MSDKLPHYPSLDSAAEGCGLMILMGLAFWVGVIVGFVLAGWTGVLIAIVTWVLCFIILVVFG